jgi:hypothetical protein
MDGVRGTRRRERATTTLETVGLAVAVAVLVGGIATSMAGSGSPLGEAVGARVEQLVDGEHASADVSASARIARKRTRTWHERQWSGGDDPLHVPRDELRLTPIIDPLAIWIDEWHRQGRVAGVDSRIEVRACAMCTALEWSHGIRSGAGIDERGSDVGFEGTIRAAARLALVSADATIRARRELGPMAVSGQGRGRVTLGGDAEGEATLRLSRATQQLELDGSAMAGGVARAEGRVGVDLLGIAIRQGGRAEGWAGAGARGTIGVRREPDRLSWRFGWGAAVGLGGAAEWSGSIDISHVPQRHRDLARRSLLAAMHLGPFPVTPFIR